MREGLIAAAYRHRMSRALDPQLHTHVVAANLARGPDGRFTALHGAPLYRAAKTAGYLYQAHLRAAVSDRLGLEWGEVRKGAAELAGCPGGGACASSRSVARRCCARPSCGGISLDSRRRRGEAAALATRERKQYGIDTHTWREEVQAARPSSGFGQRRDRRGCSQLVGERGSRTACPSATCQTRRCAGRPPGGPDGLDRARQHVRRARGAAGVRGRGRPGRAGRGGARAGGAVHSAARTCSDRARRVHDGRSGRLRAAADRRRWRRARANDVGVVDRAVAAT